jgi:hypothetical protein
MPSSRVFVFVFVYYISDMHMLMVNRQIGNLAGKWNGDTATECKAEELGRHEQCRVLRTRMVDPGGTGPDSSTEALCPTIYWKGASVHWSDHGIGNSSRDYTFHFHW